jgi:hypothetical protein
VVCLFWLLHQDGLTNNMNVVYFETVTPPLSELKEFRESVAKKFQFSFIESQQLTKVKNPHIKLWSELLNLYGRQTRLPPVARASAHTIRFTENKALLIPVFDDLRERVLEYIRLLFSASRLPSDRVIAFCALIHLHPFKDGNGRFFRALSATALAAAVKNFDAELWCTLWRSDSEFTALMTEGFEHFRARQTQEFSRCFSAALTRCVPG